MAVENQADSMFAGNRHVLRWNGILDDDDTILDLTGRIVKFALTRKAADGNPLLTPILDFRSDMSAQISIQNPSTGNPHVDVELLPADTATLAPRAPVEYYCELEVFDTGGLSPVVVATIDLTIKPNVTNV